MSDISSI